MGKYDVDGIKASNPLPETVERLTGQRIEKHKIFAPWRQESTPSVHVYDDGSWWDYGAGFGGDVIAFVGYLFYGTSYDSSAHFHDIVDRLGALDIAPLPATTTRPKPQKPANKLGVSFEQVYRWNESMPSQRREYWQSRGLTNHTIDEFLLGWDGIRYTIPALYRMQVFGVKRRQSEIDDGKKNKYTQLTGGRVGIFNADNLWEAQHVIICEGEIDCMLLHQAGFSAVSSTGGAGSWKAEWSKFFTHIKDLYILYDNDDAGRLGAKKIQRALRRAHVMSLPEGVKDIGELFEHSSDPVAWLKHCIK